MIHKVFEKEYYGFESLYDMERDVSEAIEYSDVKIPGEFQGTIKVTITYDDSEDKTVD